MSLIESVAGLGRAIVHVEHAPKAPVLERHLQRVDSAFKREFDILNEIRIGQCKPGTISELAEVMNERMHAQTEDLRVDRTIVIFNRARLPWTQINFFSVA